MTLRSKMAPDAVERAHCALEALPQYRPDELTKRQAVQRLLGPIRETRAKGYSLAAISKLLSECGISITTGALRAYIGDAGREGAKRNRRRAKRGTYTAKGDAPTRSRSNEHAAAAQPGETREQRAPSGQPQPVDLDWDPAVRDRAESGQASRPPGRRTAGASS